MAQIKVVDEEKKGDDKKDSQGESKVPAEETVDVENSEKKEVPLDKMSKRDLIGEINEIEETAKQNYDLYLRSQAEMENVKKRFRKEKEDLIKYSNETLIKQLLSAVDNLDKALDSLPNNKSQNALGEGVELTLKGLMDTLQRTGLEGIKAVGEPFDPNFHEAVSMQEDDTVSPGTVLQELQKGYLLNQRLIRPAMVIVSKNSD